MLAAAPGQGGDAAWDRFIEENPRGQFQQSSGWARVKSLDGWQAKRIFVRPEAPAAGGMQLLWKAVRFGRIGYVSKGPVLADEQAEDIAKGLGQLTAAARELRLQAVIVQPPDESRIAAADFSAHGFAAEPVPGIIRATALINLADGYEAVLNRMGRQTRREARQAVNRGVSVRLGERSDLRTFFGLMAETCRRQNTSPNPSRVESLEALWDAFFPRVMLGMARLADEPAAGLLMIGCGRRLTFWKKGWNARDSRSYANTCLNVEAIRWACEAGYATVDFGGIDPITAETLLSGAALTEEQKRTRDMFNLRLGAEPKLVPPARLLVVKPALRIVFAAAFRSRTLRRWILQRLSRG